MFENSLCACEGVVNWLPETVLIPKLGGDYPAREIFILADTHFDGVSALCTVFQPRFGNLDHLRYIWVLPRSPAYPYTPWPHWLHRRNLLQEGSWSNKPLSGLSCPWRRVYPLSWIFYRISIFGGLNMRINKNLESITPQQLRKSYYMYNLTDKMLNWGHVLLRNALPWHALANMMYVPVMSSQVEPSPRRKHSLAEQP